jgi:ABC-type branched-subunit amino acid transport system substrate-binding protein
MLGMLAPAASGAELVLGQSLGLTGGGAEVAKQYLSGAKCHFDIVNKGGGVRGNTLRLVSLDDGGNRDKTVENTRKLIDGEKAFVLFGYTAAAGAQAVFPLIEERGIPLLGIASGGLGVHDKHRRYVYHVRASYTAELDGIVKVLGSSGLSGSVPQYGFIYNQDAKANLGAFEEVAKKNGIRMVSSAAIDRNSTDMQAPIKTILDGKPSVIVAITTAKAMAAVIKEARKQGYNGTIVSSSFAGDPLVKEAGPAGAGTIVAQVVPDPLHQGHAGDARIPFGAGEMRRPDAAQCLRARGLHLRARAGGRAAARRGAAHSRKPHDRPRLARQARPGRRRGDVLAQRPRGHGIRRPAHHFQERQAEEVGPPHEGAPP